MHILFAGYRAFLSSALPKQSTKHIIIITTSLLSAHIVLVSCAHRTPLQNSLCSGSKGWRRPTLRWFCLARTAKHQGEVRRRAIICSMGGSEEIIDSEAIRGFSLPLSSGYRSDLFVCFHLNNSLP